MDKRSSIFVAIVAVFLSLPVRAEDNKPWAKIQTRLYSCASSAVNAQLAALVEAREWAAMEKLAGEQCEHVPWQEQEMLDYEQAGYCTAPAYESESSEIWSPARSGADDFRWVQTETRIEQSCGQRRAARP